MEAVWRTTPLPFKALAAAMAAGILSTAGVLGNVAAAETAFVVGGARGPGIPWDDYTNRAGRGFHPNATRVIVAGLRRC